MKFVKHRSPPQYSNVLFDISDRIICQAEIFFALEY